MNAMFATAAPLPSVLELTFANEGRRHLICDYDLSMMEVDRFNQLLARLGRQLPPLNRDQLVTAARELCDRSTEPAVPNCIGQRMRRGASIDLMIGDAGWEPANDAANTADLVVGYVRGRNDLIPDQLQKVGRLDDAIVIDTAWARLVDEIECYLDFRRLRHIEAVLRGIYRTDFGFTRDDWQEARYAEAALFAHQREVRDRSYVSMPAPVFHVH